jgi:Trk-type K+ transport system membrane component
MHILIYREQLVASTSNVCRATQHEMAGARRLISELLHRLHWCFDTAASFACCLSSMAHAHHQLTERVARSRRGLRFSAGEVWRHAAVRTLLVHVLYFVGISCSGYGLLAALHVRASGARPRAIDMFFTAVSAATVSSMSAVEMEVFSNAQLVVLTALMFLGGEVFVSLLGLASKWSNLRKQTINRARRVGSHEEIELGEAPTTFVTATETSDPDNNEASATSAVTTTTAEDSNSIIPVVDAKRLRHHSVRSLFYIVLAIIVVVHVLGIVAVAAYVYAAPGARWTLRRKALNLWTFAVFTTVSTFSSCGFMPTNENMAVFSRDAPLQLLLVPQALVGNTLFPPLLAACVWAAAKATRREDLAALVTKGREVSGYYHLLPARRCWMLAATVVGFVAVQVALMCAMEWGGALRGLSAWEKVVNAVFIAVNSRHTGETTIDLSTFAPAILVLFVLMM